MINVLEVKAILDILSAMTVLTLSICVFFFIAKIDGKRRDRRSRLQEVMRQVGRKHQRVNLIMFLHKLKVISLSGKKGWGP